MSNIDYTLWTNAGGTLGQNKVQIPTGTANDPWPAGDALVHNFVYQNGKLVGFVDTKALIANESKSTTFPYDYVNIQVDKSLEGVMTFNQGERTKYLTITYSGNSGDDVIVTIKYKGCKTVDDVKTVDPDYLTNDIVDGVWKEGLGDLEQGGNGNYNGGMFYACRNLTSFTSDLSSLTVGGKMFQGCSNLTTFTSNLSNLTDGKYMFAQCKNITTFTSDLPSLTDGECMFNNCPNLTSFSADSSGSPVNLSSLTDGNNMFYVCRNLTSFSSNLRSLTNGNQMFNGCSALTSFSSNLSSLTNAWSMFSNCKLDTASVQNIADTINTHSGTIHVGIGNTTPNEQEEAAFNKIASKGWTVYVNGEGTSNQWTPTSLTPLDGEETVTPIPYWAKPVPSDEKHAQYVDENGNFYNILGAQFIYGDNLETYGMFINEEDAATQMRLTKIEKK